MKLAGLGHPKTKDLALRLDITLPHAVGLLEFLWAFVAQQTPQGNIGRWRNEVIAKESQWSGDADEFVTALIESGFLDPCPTHRLLIHDWDEHCPNWVRAKLKKKELTFLSRGVSLDLSESLSADSEPGAEGSTSQVKARQDMTSDIKSHLLKPSDIDAQVWRDFRALRTAKHSPLTPTAWAAIRQELDAGIAAGYSANEMLSEATAAGWQAPRFTWFKNRINNTAGEAQGKGKDAQESVVARAKQLRASR